MSATQLTATFDRESVDRLTKLALEVQKAAQAADTQGDGDRKHTIHITNKVPRTIVGIIREQFKLMEGWMQPLLSATHANNQDLQQLKHRLEAALGQYRDVLARRSRGAGGGLRLVGCIKCTAFAYFYASQLRPAQTPSR